MRRDDLQRRAVSLVCRCCGQELPVSRFQRYRTGTYRHVCKQCAWVRYGKPTRIRRILRELEERQNEI